MARKIDLTKSPESHCPRFASGCNINKCPLIRNYEELQNDVTDHGKINKEKCTSKTIRKEIGEAFGLKYGGMTTREYNGAKRWESLSDSDKKKAVKKLQDLSPIVRLHKKGYIIAPKRKNNPKIHGQNDEKGLREGVE